MKYVVLLLAALLGSAPVALAQSEPPVRVLPGYIKFPDKQHALISPVPYRLPGQKHVLVIPAGFVTDFASIPALLRPLFSHDDVHDLPALLHDYLYWTQSCSQAQADEMFRDALREVGVSWVESATMYRALRMAGSPAWKGNGQARRDRMPRIIPADRMQIPIGMRWADYRARLRSMQIPVDTPEASPAPYCKS